MDLQQLIGFQPGQNRRIPMYFLIDSSDAMAGEPVLLVSKIIRAIYQESLKDPVLVEQAAISIITYGGTNAQQILPLTELDNVFVMPELNIGGPPMLGAAFRVLKEALSRELKPNQPGQKGDYKATIFLLAGSKPLNDWQNEINDLRASQFIKVFTTVLCTKNIVRDDFENITRSILLIDNFDAEKFLNQYIRKFVSQTVFLPSTMENQVINRSQMKEVSFGMTSRPFGKVNYWDQTDGSSRMVRATILTDFVQERARFGIAIDGSRSMEPLLRTYHSPLSKEEKVPPYHINRIVPKLAHFLAHKDWKGTVSMIYWATGTGHQGIQDLGDISENFTFSPPRSYGNKTHLLPALRYFAGREQRQDLYHNDGWGIYVFVTDGGISDLEAVKDYSVQLAKEISSGKRNGQIKLILIGIGDLIDKAQFDALDDLETGTEIDLWDTRLLSEINDLDNPYELFAEMADPGIILAPGDGIVRDSSGNVVADFRDSGLPAVLKFTLPFGEPVFSLEVGGKIRHQALPFAGPDLEQSFLELSTNALDFGSVDKWDQDLSQIIYLYNSGRGIWNGSVTASDVWLNVQPILLECPPKSGIKLNVTLRPRAAAHLKRGLNTGAVTISGVGYNKTIPITVSTSGFKLFSTDEERVVSTWETIHDSIEDLSPKLFEDRTKTLTKYFCERFGFSLVDGPNLIGDFCYFVLDVSPAFEDTNLAIHLPLVYSRQASLNDNDLSKLNMIFKKFDLRGRLLMLLIIFAEQEIVQEVYKLILASRAYRKYDIAPLGKAEIKSLVYAHDPHKAMMSLALRHINLEAINPFQTNAPASDNTFSGREFELSTISGNVREKSFAVIGGRRIGKSSLLFRLHRDLHDDGFRTLFYDCGLSIGQGFLNSDPNDWLPDPPNNSPRTFRDLLDAPPSDKPFVLLLDEVDELIQEDAANNWAVFKILRGWINSHRMQVVVCGANNLLTALNDSKSPLYNLFHSTLRLERLDYPATKQLITRPMHQLQIDLKHEQAIVNLIWNHTDGHPCIVQRLCAKLIQKINQDMIIDLSTAHQQISLTDVQELVENIEFLKDDLISVYLEQATYLEWIIVLSFIQEKNTSYDIKEIRTILQRIQPDIKLRKIKPALARLVDLRRILKQTAKGRYTFDVTALPKALSQPNISLVEDLLEQYIEDFLDYGDVQLRITYQHTAIRGS